VAYSLRHRESADLTSLGLGSIVGLLALLGGGSLSLLVLGSDQRLVSTVLTPVDDEGLADEEQHDCDLGNGEEAPDGCLLEQVGCDPASESRAEHEEEDSLDDHTSLLVESKEGGEHEERVDGSAGDDVCGVSHGNRPGKVIVSSESAELLSS